MCNSNDWICCLSQKYAASKKKKSSGNISQASESVLRIALGLYLQLVNKVVERNSRGAAVQEMLSGFRWTREMLILISHCAHLQGLGC